MMVSVKAKKFSVKNFECLNMVFAVDETWAKKAFLPLGATLCLPKSILTAQIHVKLILIRIILAKVLQQPILCANG